GIDRRAGGELRGAVLHEAEGRRLAKSDDSARGESARGGGDGVTLINGTRQSLAFQVPGRPVHLLPGEGVVLPEAYLDTLEVKYLCQQGALLRKGPSPEVHGGPDAGAAHGGRGDRGRTRPHRGK